MSDAVIESFLGRPPDNAERAIYKDQEKRLAQIYQSPLIPRSDALRTVPPFEMPQL